MCCAHMEPFLWNFDWSGSSFLLERFERDGSYILGWAYIKVEENLPPDNIPQPKDEVSEHDDDGGIDDSNIPTCVVIQAMVQGSDDLKDRYSMHPEGGITTNAMAERFDDEEVKIDKDQLGHGKHQKWVNQQYTQFWRYNNDDSSDAEHF